MTEEGADRKGNAFVYVTMCTCTLTYSTRIRVHVRARCSVRLWGNCWCAGVGAGMKLADGREKPRRSEKRCRGRRRKGESWWGALERVEWVRGVSFEPLNFAKFETVRGRGDSPSDVHSASTLLLPPLLSFYLSLSFSISLFPSWFSLHRPLLLSTQCTTVLAVHVSLLFLCFLSSGPRLFLLPVAVSIPPSPLSPLYPKPRFGVPSQPSWYYGNFEPIRKSIVPARKPRGGLRCNHALP